MRLFILFLELVRKLYIVNYIVEDKEIGLLGMNKDI